MKTSSQRSWTHSVPETSWVHAAWLCGLLLAAPLACGENPAESASPNQDSSGAAPESAIPTAPDGAQLYGLYCSLCHGPDGEGYTADAANALANPEFLAIASDDFLISSIQRGRPSTPMSAWGVERGGPLDDVATQSLVEHIRSWQTAPSVQVDDVTVEGEVERGSTIYAVHCISCHGPNGEGGSYMSINNPEFLASASDGFLQYAIAKGRSATPMGAYDTVLTGQQIDDLVVLIRSWQIPVDDTPIPSVEFDPSIAVLNPNGPDPSMGDDPRFVSVALLADAYQAGAKMVLIDARPPADYVDGHITGAVSVPFYGVQDVAEQLPKDVWIVTYCACPHAEAGAAADALVAEGFDKVRVLDEGYPGWTEEGLPVTEGPLP